MGIPLSDHPASDPSADPWTMMMDHRHRTAPAVLDGLPLEDSWANAIVSGCARRRGESLWTVVLYDFSIRAHGATLHDAVDAAGAELVIYISHECKRLARSSVERLTFSFEEVKRPLETRKRAKWELGAFFSRAWHLVDDDSPFDVYPLSLPLACATYVADPTFTEEAIAENGDFGDARDLAEEALMAEGYRELAHDLHAFAELAIHAGAETLPEK